MSEALVPSGTGEPDSAPGGGEGSFSRRAWNLGTAPPSGLIHVVRTEYHLIGVELRRISLERYKGYARRTELELAPLTILVGPNNAGKTALAQAVPLVAGGLAPSDGDGREPLPLKSYGVRHGEAFADLVTGRAVHGRLRVSVTLEGGRGESSLSATVRNVVAPGRAAERQVSVWQLQSSGQQIAVERQGFGATSEYLVAVPGASPALRPITWRGLLPKEPRALAEWLGPQIDDLQAWAAGVRHLRCPRRLLPSPYRATERAPANIGPDGRDAPLALAADDALLDSVRDWFRKTFGVRIDLVAQGHYFDLVTGASLGDANVRIGQAGRGLSHVLPIAVTALTALRAGSGVNIVEHPEAELHPAAHAGIAELLLENLAGPARPLIVETHSEMILLRARRWVAEGRLRTGDVLVYWIHTEPGHGSLLERIEILANGEMEAWPEGVFIEDYDEILAIRRAARGQVKA